MKNEANCTSLELPQVSILVISNMSGCFFLKKGRQLRFLKPVDNFKNRNYFRLSYKTEGELRQKMLACIF